jgi:hypothetical protein
MPEHLQIFFLYGYDIAIITQTGSNRFQKVRSGIGICCSILMKNARANDEYAMRIKYVQCLYNCSIHSYSCNTGNMQNIQYDFSTGALEKTSSMLY